MVESVCLLKDEVSVKTVMKKNPPPQSDRMMKVPTALVKVMFYSLVVLVLGLSATILVAYKLAPKSLSTVSANTTIQVNQPVPVEQLPQVTPQVGVKWPVVTNTAVAVSNNDIDIQFTGLFLKK